MKSATRQVRSARPNKLYPSDQKACGEWVELLFMAEAARRGLKVARPLGEARYDVLVEGAGEIYRVQVKSTTFKRRECYECLCFWSRVTKTRRAKQYSETQIDLVAAYVVPEDTWFLIPVSELRTSTLYLPPKKRASKSKYGRFLEKWELLGVDQERVTIHAAEDRTELVIELIKRRLRVLQNHS